MLDVVHVQKRFGEKTVLDDLSMKVQSGEIYGLIGPIGAGKTTFMKICMGLLQADGGSIHLFGSDILKEKRMIQESAGYLPEKFQIYDKMKVLEYLEFFSTMYGLSYSVDKYLRELLDMVNLTKQADSYVKTLSRAKKQQLGVARCLVHNPVLLMLDEPLAGLDPVGKTEIMETLRYLKQQGKTIVLSSSSFAELQNTCTQIGIIKNGSIEIEGTIKQVLSQARESRAIHITVLGDMSLALLILKANANVKRISIAEDVLEITFHGNKGQEAQLLYELVSKGVQVISFSRTNGSLEDAFFELEEEKERRREQYENKSSLFERFKIKR
ncbi:ABC transporter ATP-binding protein [[Clostridium] polysaccharolyticum]|uniref:ABC-2 type transport system ATP-binding protein n=1 Tax=[Clostridium] polysaccharolyticum TaxID=29364 RepID=A0A1H9ZED7_9FIRM|nr:ABC transporter ATP-binding protein [[Clostridium] polysaccharolyticum]SES80019.1 ABC-2 type transport system ATP-binding protein [[Clostridium] polysaccharolyticum]